MVYGRLTAAVRRKTGLLARGAIIAGLIAVPNTAWPQALEGVAPVQKTEAAIEDHSYLPPSMRGEYLPPNAVPAAAPQKAARRAKSRAKRERRYAQASAWGFFRN
jgi:hypothetical protein